MNRLKLRMVAVSCFALAATLGMSACGAEDQTPAAKDKSAASEPAPGAAPAPAEEKVAAAETAPAAAPAAETAPAAAPKAEETPAAESAPAAAPAETAQAEGAAEPEKKADAPAAAGEGEKKFEGGKWVLPDGTPTYNIKGHGSGEERIIDKVDWYTYSGWRRYHAECHVCHGPNAKGSTYAPALADSLKTMTYEKFLQVVASGQERDVGGTKFVMPALGDNKNVMCYIDDLYVYLKARASEELPPGRLSADQREEKPAEAKEYEDSCLGP